MKKSVVILSAVALLITIPIYMYLLYFLLRNADAGRLEMFLFWIYAPASFVLAPILTAIAGGD